MKRISSVLCLWMLLAGLAACGSPPEPDGDGSADTVAAPTSSPARERPDTMALLPIMVQLEQDMESISSGLWRHDFEQIAASADNITHHPKIRRSQIGTIRSILGDTRFQTFVRDDKRVHSMALELRQAAREEDFKRTAEIYQNLQQGCISCHLSHRNTLRDSPRWR